MPDRKTEPLRPVGVVAHSAHGAWGPRSDDRWIADPEHGLFLVANGSGPTYGGYYAPFALDPGIDAFTAAYRGAESASPARLRAAFDAAQNIMRDLAGKYDRARGQRTGLEAASRATEAVRPEAWRGVPGYCHFGGSITATSLSGRSIVVGQVGDCRAYVERDGAPHLLVSDHSLPTVVGTKEGFNSSAYRNALENHRVVTTRLLGVQNDVAPDCAEVELGNGTRILLCTAGIWNHAQGETSVRHLFHAEPDEFRRFLENHAADSHSDATAIRFSAEDA